MELAKVAFQPGSGNYPQEEGAPHRWRGALENSRVDDS